MKDRCPAVTLVNDSRGDELAVRCDQDVNGQPHKGQHEVTLQVPGGIGWVIKWGKK